MKIITEVFYFGSLGRERGEAHSPCDLQGPTPLRELLNRLQIPTGQVQLVMVNHKAVPPSHLIQPGDRVALFPKEYAIFADWKDMRF